MSRARRERRPPAVDDPEEQAARPQWGGDEEQPKHQPQRRPANPRPARPDPPPPVPKKRTPSPRAGASDIPKLEAVTPTAKVWQKELVRPQLLLYLCICSLLSFNVRGAGADRAAPPGRLVVFAARVHLGLVR